MLNQGGRGSYERRNNDMGSAFLPREESSAVHKTERYARFVSSVQELFLFMKDKMSVMSAILEWETRKLPIST